MQQEEIAATLNGFEPGKELRKGVLRLGRKKRASAQDDKS
jgi:hypothetical protein